MSLICSTDLAAAAGGISLVDRRGRHCRGDGRRFFISRPPVPFLAGTQERGAAAVVLDQWSARLSVPCQKITLEAIGSLKVCDLLTTSLWN